ncbi:MAG: tRNA (adenosine(37)-N6)-threonylcarbamoyltransferase complex transferase subunit TsaD [Candidatus Cloacimonetes bacterium]|nr:tRNA (adenosine(37)-N6)-threonylcarbamoyltransferase complex transferase subunit TsaD [Candidatus Cloacimonadota bacterium]
MSNQLILAFESSCDDTSVAVVSTDYKVLSNVTSSQPVHEEFGGVVPELASRAHITNIIPVTKAALSKAEISLRQIDAVAVSVNPGLIGSLLVGVSFAKSVAWSQGKPLIAVNHMLGHVFANKLTHPELEPPYLALVVSGGHTELVHFLSETEFTIIGKTRDDASGEAFDKIAKLLKLGYPGGPIIDKLAKGGNPDFYRFPRGMNRKGIYDFSFSGMKTAVSTYIQEQSDEYIQANLSDILASIQAAIVDSLVSKTVNYAKQEHIGSIIVAGGVSANSALRERFEAYHNKYNIYFPELEYCMDNAAMIGAAAVGKLQRGEFADTTLNAFSRKGLRYV